MPSGPATNLPYRANKQKARMVKTCGPFDVLAQGKTSPTDKAQADEAGQMLATDVRRGQKIDLP